MSLVTRTPLALELGHCDLTNRVNYDELCHRFLSEPAVDIPPMANPANDDELLGVVHVIEDAIIAHPQPKSTLRALQALHTMRPWLYGQVADTGIDAR
jgi:hypothetical protein